MQADVNAMNNALVLTNNVVFGTVKRRPADTTSKRPPRWRKADPDWLNRLLTRRVDPAHWTASLTKAPDDIKVVVTMQQ